MAQALNKDNEKPFEVGSRSAPIETPLKSRFSIQINRLSWIREGPHFGAESQPVATYLVESRSIGGANLLYVEEPPHQRIERELARAPDDQRDQEGEPL